MSTRRETEVGIQPADAPSPRRHFETGASPISERLRGPRTLDEAEAQYVAARDAWTAAMRQASSGRSADLAALAIAQQAYEAAALEVERARSGPRLAVPIEPEPRSIDAVVGQELAWRRVHEADARRRPGLLGRIARRLTGR